MSLQVGLQQQKEKIFDVNIDKEILLGLDNVSTKEAYDPNPKQVIIDLHSDFIGNHNGHISAYINEVGLNNPTIYETVNCGDKEIIKKECIIGALREHVKKYGTIDEVAILGHGYSGVMGSKDEKMVILIKSFMDGLADLEKELGCKITNRIVFNGCSTFSRLTPNQIDFYRCYADEHDIEIVGSTSFINCGLGNNIGKYVQFTPKGEIIRDPKIHQEFSIIEILDIGRDIDNSWTDCYIGTTPETNDKAKECWNNKNR